MREWGCSGRSNEELINNLSTLRDMDGIGTILSSERVIAAMKKADRKHYVPDPSSAYEDRPQPIPYGDGATISAPHMHAHAVEHLAEKLQPGARVLDVGSGSGYLCAVLHHLVSPDGEKKGKVVGIDHMPRLVQWSVENLKKDGLKNDTVFVDTTKGDEVSPADGKLTMVCGDGRQGYPPGAPYDAIHVGAAAPTMPQALIDQLANDGRMFIPVGPEYGLQHIVQVDKNGRGEVTKRNLMGVAYVGLKDRPA
ncbi:protein-L-isoaspartate O-methyltransferase [Coniophora puteana RWD-64-598 SS2]|uniref:Protein-L-isoaspartate O-methyltransferase n=1 Tax=Coniophora puteana (strain RWD-64-598) TaxID=741705 RepID=A0A5M3MGG7_CONPW|nr:protein-L-isoaspartate O-methyltransferase [Coniophora puteana RWD-64-598 SS2]EIW78312.1 protein-L-isoaspartate O-methyltransferase [Coniophora puteana RWD-64-598 SS2]